LVRRIAVRAPYESRSTLAAEEEPSPDKQRVRDLERQLAAQRQVIRSLERSLQCAGKILMPFVRKAGER
jgi:hypothetical protein